MSGKLTTRVPCHLNELKPRLPDYKLVSNKEKAHRDKMKAEYDRRHRVVQPNGPFSGDRVQIPDLKREGTVMRYEESPRSNVIETSTSDVRHVIFWGETQETQEATTIALLLSTLHYSPL